MKFRNLDVRLAITAVLLAVIFGIFTCYGHHSNCYLGYIEMYHFDCGDSVCYACQEAGEPGHILIVPHPR